MQVMTARGVQAELLGPITGFATNVEWNIFVFYHVSDGGSISHLTCNGREYQRPTGFDVSWSERTGRKSK